MKMFGQIKFAVQLIFSLAAALLSVSAAEIGEPLAGRNDFPWGNFRKNTDQWRFSGKDVGISPAAGKAGLPALHFNVAVCREGQVVKATSPRSSGLKADNWYEFSYFVRVRRRDYSSRFRFRIDLGGGKEINSGSNEELHPADGGKKWIFICKQFKLPAGCDSARVEFYFINGAGELWISDCRLVKLSKRARIIPHIPLPEAVASRGRKPVSTSSLTFGYGGNRLLKFKLNGKEVPPLIHKFCDGSPVYGCFNAFEAAGIKIHIIQEGRSPRSFWVGRDKYDFSGIDARIKTALERDPGMNIILGVGLYPYAAFGNDYPEECWRDADGRRCIRNFKTGKKLRRGETLLRPGDYFCFAFASRAWRRGGVKALQALLKHIDGSPYGKSIAGVHLSPAQDGQFFPWTSTRNYGVRGIGAMDFSDSQLQYFREYLRKKYHNDVEMLRKAWKQPEVTFEQARFPTVEQLNQPAMFRDDSAPAIDCRAAMSDVIAEVYKEFARAVKQAAGRPFFVSAYYPDATMGSANAHYATAKLLEGDEIDAIACPAHYGPDRINGSCGGFENAVSSYPLHDKVHICEWDHRTWRSPVFRDDVYYLGFSKNAEEFAAMLRREAGMALAFNYGAWFYEMDPGWYSDPALKKEIKNIFMLMSAAAQKPGLRNFKPDVAVFVDEKMMDFLPERQASIFNVSTRHVIKALNLSGVPYRIYLQSDLTHPRLPDFKLYFFLNPAVFTKEQKAYIQNRLRKDGKTIVWTYAAGCGKSTDPAEAISRLTGIRVKLDSPRRHNSKALALPSKNPSAENPEYYLQVPYSVSVPIFSVDDPSAVPLARHSYDRSICTAVKRFGNWTSVYAAVPGSFTPQFIHRLARDAKAFVCGAAGDAVYLSPGALVVHGCGGKNPRHLKLPAKCRVKDPFSGKVYSAGTDGVTVDVPVRQTRCFLLEKIDRADPPGGT